MSIHPAIAEVLASLPAPPPGPLNPVAMRAGEEAQVAPLSERLPLASVTDVVAETASGQVPVRVYTDSPRVENGVIVYFHGGAFFLGSLETHDHVCRLLAKQTGWTVVSVDFRRAPESAFPAGLDDCYGVVRWVAETEASDGEANEIRWDGHRLAIAGDSSGGTFGAAVAAKALDDGFDGISHQILYYPSLDLDFDESRYGSLTENATGYGLETAGLKPFNAFYLDSGADPADPLVSPIKRQDLAGLPKALIVTAQYHPLRDEGELYAERLREAGVEATLIRYENANHGFVQNFSWIPEMQQVYRDTAEFLRS